MIQSVVQLPAPQPPTRHQKMAAKLAAGALILAAIFMAVLLFWAAQNEEVLQIKNAPFPVRTVNDNAQANDVVILNTDYCKTKNVTGRLRMSFVSQTREIFLPIAEERTPVGCDQREIPILLPKDLVADTYKVRFQIMYNINPLKKNVPVSFESVEFKVSQSGSVEDTPSQ